MSLVELVREDFIDISYDTRDSWIYANWKGYQTVSSVQQGCERMLELLTEYQANRVLNDNTNVIGIWQGAAEWLATDWFPRMREGGLRCFAWVYSASRFSQVSTDATLSLIHAGEVGVQVFYNRAEAADWLRTCTERQ